MEIFDKINYSILLKLSKEGNKKMFLEQLRMCENIGSLYMGKISDYKYSNKNKYKDISVLYSLSLKLEINYRDIVILRGGVCPLRIKHLLPKLENEIDITEELKSDYFNSIIKKLKEYNIDYKSLDITLDDICQCLDLLYKDLKIHDVELIESIEHSYDSYFEDNSFWKYNLDENGYVNYDEPLLEDYIRESDFWHGYLNNIDVLKLEKSKIKLYLECLYGLNSDIKIKYEIIDYLNNKFGLNMEIIDSGDFTIVSNIESYFYLDDTKYNGLITLTGISEKENKTIYNYRINYIKEHCSKRKVYRI